MSSRVCLRLALATLLIIGLLQSSVAGSQEMLINPTGAEVSARLDRPKLQLIESVNPQLDTTEPQKDQEQQVADEGHERSIEKRYWAPRGQRNRMAARREEMMNLLLQELPELDIEALNGNSERHAPGAKQQQYQQYQKQQQLLQNRPEHQQHHHNQDEQAHQQQQQQQQQSIPPFQPISGEDELAGMLVGAAGAKAGSTANAASAAAAASANNRLRGRSAFLMGGNPQAVENGGVNNFPKRASGRHVPCFFNAISCF